MQMHRWMTSSGALTLAALALLFVGCGGGGGGGGGLGNLPSAPSGTEAVIGTEGGEVEVTEGSLDGTKLVVPAGALTGDETIRISSGSQVSGEAEHHAVGPSVKIEPHGLTFAGSGTTLRIPYDPSSLPPGTSAESLAVLKKAADGTIHRLDVVGMPADGDFLEVAVGSLSSFQAVLTVVDATGNWVIGSVGGEFDPSQFDIDDFNLDDFDFEDFDPGEFDFEDFDFADFDFGDFDFGDFDLSNFDLANFDLSDFNLGALGEIEGLPVEVVEITQDTAKGTFSVITNQTDADGKTVIITGTFDGPLYSGSASYPMEGGTEQLDLEFELYSDSFGVGTAITTLGSDVTTENLGMVRAESLIEEPVYGSGLTRIALNISELTDPSDATLPGSSLDEGSYSGTFVQLAADETTGLVIATYILDSDTGNPFIGTVSGTEYLFFRQVDQDDGANLIEILQLTRTSKNTFVPGVLGEYSFSWIYSDGGEGTNFGSGSASLGN